MYVFVICGVVCVSERIIKLSIVYIQVLNVQGTLYDCTCTYLSWPGRWREKGGEEEGEGRGRRRCYELEIC